MKAAPAIAVGIALALSSLPGQEPAVPQAEVRFSAIDVFVDSEAQPLAAYQLTVTAPHGDVRIVGIEGGEHAAFKEPPYYDPKAMQKERVILGAFNTSPAEQLPRGKTRVATIHVQVSGPTILNVTAKLEAAATSEGHSITAQISLVERNAK